MITSHGRRRRERRQQSSNNQVLDSMRNRNMEEHIASSLWRLGMYSSTIPLEEYQRSPVKMSSYLLLFSSWHRRVSFSVLSPPLYPWPTDVFFSLVISVQCLFRELFLIHSAQKVIYYFILHIIETRFT